MMFLLLVSVLFSRLKRGDDLLHTVQLKPTIKVQISGRIASIGISNVAFASVYSEKTRMKKLMMIIIMNKSQETTVFGGCQNLTSAMKQRPEK